MSIFMLWSRRTSLAASALVLVLAFGATTALAQGERPNAEADLSEPPPFLSSRAANPHGDLSLPCTDCHTTDGWIPLADPLPFDHAQTGYDLVAGHRNVGCFDCHGDLRFAHVPTTCADCHRDPHLGALGLSCASCHDTRGWFEAEREMRQRHAATLFPLTGAHAALDCAACHAGTPPHQFATAPTSCFSCHQGDFQRARNPNHVSAGFPTTCETCHTTDDWRPADFRAHDSLFFPIFSGVHEGTWTACSDCHVAPANLAVFSCFACHGRREMADEHDDVAGYRYDSLACYTCHPDGRE